MKNKNHNFLSRRQSVTFSQPFPTLSSGEKLDFFVCSTWVFPFEVSCRHQIKGRKQHLVPLSVRTAYRQSALYCCQPRGQMRARNYRLEPRRSENGQPFLSLGDNFHRPPYGNEGAVVLKKGDTEAKSFCECVFVCVGENWYFSLSFCCFSCKFNHSG